MRSRDASPAAGYIAALSAGLYLGSAPGDKHDLDCLRRRPLFHLAHARRSRAVRVLHFGPELWAAVVARFLYDAALQREQLGPRCVRARHRHSKSVVGPGPAARGRDCGQVRRTARTQRRRAHVRAGSLSDRSCDGARARVHLRGRARWLRPVGLRGAHRDRRARQAIAGELADTCVRRGDGSRLVWPVPVLAARGQPDGRVRLADYTRDLLLSAVADSADLADIDGAEAAGWRVDGAAAQAIAPASARGSVRAPLLRA